MTLEKLIAQAEARFAAARLHYGHGTDNARDEAAFLVLRGLGLPFDQNLRRRVLLSESRRVASLVERRIGERIPAAYLLREAWLDGLPFYIDRRVIVPRSHIAFLLNGLRMAPRRILDLCTGSGCLAILAARAFPRARVDATDISREALAVAARNVATYRLGKRVKLARADLFPRGRYDLILANPPYVPTTAMRRLPAEYRHEPGIALAGGAGGLQLIGRILEASPDHLSPGGLLVCEVGDGRRALERAYPRAGLAWPVPEVFIFEPSRTHAASRMRPTPARARR